MRNKLEVKNSKISEIPKAIVFDFDGVFTDNRVGITENGEEFAICSRSDGLGISQLKRLNIPLLILSTETNPIVEHRARKLGIECIYGVKNKINILKEWIRKNNINRPIMYMGNDINDSECLSFADIAVLPSDAHSDVVPFADIVLCRKGGNGAVRELCDFIVKLANIHE